MQRIELLVFIVIKSLGRGQNPLPNTELYVPNAVIVAFQFILEEQMPTVSVFGRFSRE